MSTIAALLCLLILFCTVTSHSSHTATPVDHSRKLKLTYFDARGSAEISRIMLKIGGIEFEDCRFPITSKPTVGFETSEFVALKESGQFGINMDRLPVLRVDDTVSIGQSRAIERYIAILSNLMGNEEVGHALVDCISENVRDIKDKWCRVRLTGGLGNSLAKDEALTKWFSGGEFSEWLSKLERSVVQAGGHQNCAVGDTLSLADLSIWHLLRDYFSSYDSEVRSAEKKANCPKLSRIANKVGELSVIRNWLLCRPHTHF